MKVYYLKCPHCGGMAFKFKHKPFKGMKLSKDYVDFEKSGEIIRCKVCDKIVYSQDINSKNLGETDATNG